MANRFIGLKDALQFILNGDDSENEFGSAEDESDDNLSQELMTVLVVMMAWTLKVITIRQEVHA